jgi:hypothetical protein
MPQDEVYNFAQGVIEENKKLHLEIIKKPTKI